MLDLSMQFIFKILWREGVLKENEYNENIVESHLSLGLTTLVFTCLSIG